MSFVLISLAISVSFVVFAFNPDALIIKGLPVTYSCKFVTILENHSKNSLTLSKKPFVPSFLLVKI